MAAPTTVLTIIKDMTYRGVAGEQWSNTYALTGTTPADSTAWRALFDAIVLEEKKVYHNGIRVVGGLGYSRIPVTGDHAVWTLDLIAGGGTVAGTFDSSAGGLFAGDQAAWVRWSLDRFNTKGKRVYLRKYFHGGCEVASGGDALQTTYKTALANFGTFMMGGAVGGSRNICDKLGNVPIAHAQSTYATTRTLKRRGKRP